MTLELWDFFFVVFFSCKLNFEKFQTVEKVERVVQ